ncbi:hypothetical protein ACVIW2_004282 [Bradyrhizobium huanghuaihaiense]
MISEPSRTHFGIDRMSETHPSLNVSQDLIFPPGKIRLVPAVLPCLQANDTTLPVISQSSHPHRNQRSRRNCTSSARSDQQLELSLHFPKHQDFAKGELSQAAILAKRDKRGLRSARLDDLIPLPCSTLQATRLRRFRQVKSFLNAQLSTAQLAFSSKPAIGRRWERQGDPMIASRCKPAAKYHSPQREARQLFES